MFAQLEESDGSEPNDEAVSSVRDTGVVEPGGFDASFDQTLSAGTYYLAVNGWPQYNNGNPEALSYAMPSR